MSMKDLRKMLTVRGHDCDQYFGKRALIEAAKKDDATDFDDEAKALFAKLNLQPSSRDRYLNLDAIWKHPPSDAGRGGGTVYVGNYIAASDQCTLQDRNIVAIVNCQDSTTENYFEGDVGYKYHRFPVTHLAISKTAINRTTGAGALDGGFRDAFSFIQGHLEQGNSVLIHCIAGAHRAGTVGVAWLMYKNLDMNVEEAILVAKRCRNVIDPFSGLLGLLRYLQLDLKNNDHQCDSEEEYDV